MKNADHIHPAEVHRMCLCLGSADRCFWNRLSVALYEAD